MAERSRTTETVSGGTTDSFSFRRQLYQRQADARRRDFESSDASSRQPAENSDNNILIDDEKEQEYPLLLCLRLIAYHNVQIFSVSRGRKWNIREILGRGSTFAVEQADLPIREALSDFQYSDIAKGRREGFFTDHTGIRWSYDTVVAYKSIDRRRNKKMLLRDLLMELRILCHPPLQRHPTIARFLGLAWIREEDMASNIALEDDEMSESREWPILILEKADFGTVADFVRYRADCRKRISLLAKVRLAYDVLAAISDLHSCGVVHGDIKTTNALVYANIIGTAENWTAKVIDFSHAVIKPEGDSSNIKRDQLPGTDLYRPPELSKPGANFDGSIADRVDIWCWGLFLWEIIVDCGFDNATKQRIKTLRDTADVLMFAQTECEVYLKTHHRNEQGLFSSLISILCQALQEHPRLRPSAVTMVSSMQKIAHIDTRHIERGRSLHNVSPLRDLPFFDLMRQYLDLIDLLYIPRQVVEELEALKNESHASTGDVEFQLGLCYAAEFGIDCDYNEAVRLLSHSVAKGHLVARAVLHGVATALAIVPDTSMHRAVEPTKIHTRLLAWGPIRGSTALPINWPPGQNEMTVSMLSTTSFEESLIQATKRGDMEAVKYAIQNEVDVNFQHTSGETAVHLAALLPNLEIANLLLQQGADVLLCTSDAFEITTIAPVTYRIPSNVSPLALAVMIDRLPLFELFLKAVITANSNQLDPKIIVDLLAWGAQYQAINCTRYICERRDLEIQCSVDSVGLYPLSYAVRSDFLFRIVGFSSDQIGVSGQMPVIDHQLQIIQALLKVGFSLRADESTGLNCLHIAAASSNTPLLSLLLEHCSRLEPSALESISPDGFSPLGIAISRGREDACDTLIEAGAKFANAWPGIRGHALHCCALYPGAASLAIAQKILKLQPRAIHAQDDSWRTPLHCAAFRENSDLVQLLIKVKARLTSPDFNGYTPLGAAVSARSIRAIKQICTALKKKRQPLISWYFIDPFMGTKLLTYSPLEQLLSPGTISPAREPEMQIEPDAPQYGCCDFPFSESSLRVLKVLLNLYDHKSRLGTNLIEHLFFPVEWYSGLQYAISMGNIDATKLILDSRKFCHDYRLLVIYAHNQRTVGRRHIASEATREEMLNYLEEVYDTQFKELRKKRRSSLLSLIWKVYYAFYGDLEYSQWQRASTWLRNNRRLNYRPLFLEFLRWDRTRWSWHIVSFCVGWFFMAPMIVHFVLIHRVPPTSPPPSRRIYAIISLVLANVFLLAPQIFCVLSVLYRRCRKGYHGDDKPLVWLQSSFCLLVTAGCCYLCFVLQPGQEMIFSWREYRQFTPQQNNWISTFGSLSQALEGVLIAVPATELFFIWVTILSSWLIKKASTGRVDTTPKPRHLNDSVTYTPWTKIGYFFG